MKNNSEEIISIVSNTLDMMYENLGKLIAAKAKICTLKNFMHTMEMLDQTWLNEGVPVNQNAEAINTLPNIVRDYVESIHGRSYGREMINIPRQQYDDTVNAVMESLVKSQARVRELEEVLAQHDIVVSNNPVTNNQMCV